MLGVRSGQALGEAGDDRIAAVRVDDRHGQAHRLDLEHRFALDDDQVDRQADQLVGERRAPCCVVVAVAEVDRQVAAFDEAELGERGAERLDERDEARRAAAPSASRCARCAAWRWAARPVAAPPARQRQGRVDVFSWQILPPPTSLSLAIAATEVCTPARCQSSLPDAERRHRLVEALQDELARPARSRPRRRATRRRAARPGSRRLAPRRTGAPPGW